MVLRGRAMETNDMTSGREVGYEALVLFETRVYEMG